jgi:hypothetical protein
VIEVGALADLLLVNGNPLEKLPLLEDPEKNLAVIMKDGTICKKTATPLQPLTTPLGLKPPVAGRVNDLDPSELQELEFAPERPAAELPEAKLPAAEPLGQLVGVTGARRLQQHERLLLPQAIAARLRFSDLIVPIREIAWKTWMSLTRSSAHGVTLPENV